MKNKVVVVDICDTLFKSNTTFDFFRYCVETRRFNRFERYLYHLLLSKWSPFYYIVAVLERLVKKDLFKFFAVKLLASKSVDQVGAWAESCYNEFLKPRTIATTLAIVKSFDPDDVILISATIYPIAKVIASNLGIDNFLSTQLEVKDGKYTGKILNELSGRKLEALYAFKQEQVSIDVVMTDNLSDKRIMAVAECKYAVCHNKEQEKFWSSIPQINILNV